MIDSIEIMLYKGEKFMTSNIYKISIHYSEDEEKWEFLPDLNKISVNSSVIYKNVDKRCKFLKVYSEAYGYLGISYFKVIKKLD